MDPREARFAPPTEPIAQLPRDERRALPTLDVPRLETGRATHADAVVLGVPFDGTSGRRPMQRHGPELLRAALTYLAPAPPARPLQVHDAGDALVDPLDTSILDQSVQGALDAATDTCPQALPILLGGEHTISLPAARALEPATIVSLDAHSDLWKETNGRTIAHSTWLYHARDELDCTVALPLLRTLRGEAEHTIKHPRTYRELPENLPEPVYLSLDVDVFDPRDAPAVAFPEEDGPSPSTVLEMVRRVASRYELAGLDVVEVNTNRLGQTARLAAAMVLTALDAALPPDGGPADPA